MKKLSRLIFVLLLTNTVLMGCSTAKVVSLKTPAQGNAVIYLYRPEIDKPGLPPLWLQYPEVFIDGESQGVLKLNHYKVIELPAGSHTLLFTGLSENAKWDQKDIEKILSLKPGERYFLK
ncbi:MAG: hypothetical protein KDI30_07190, partial [Pseudomonadales bacterium]|nr:hypothetical protein [Pseudomonadales bacterium]